MKKILKIAAICIVSIIAAAVIALAVLYFAKPELVKAVYKGLTASENDIQADIEKNDKELVDKINDFGFSLTLEELQRLNNGNLTEQEMKELLLKGKDGLAAENGEKEKEEEISDKTEEKNQAVNPDTVIPDIKEEWRESKQHIKPAENQTSGNTSKAQKPTGGKDGKNNAQTNQDSQNGGKTQVSSEYDEKIAELVAKMYVLKSQYLGEIEGVVSSMKAEYAALPKEQQTASAKTTIASGYLGKISSLEAQCDAQVNAVVTELRGVLEKSGGDMSLADAIMSAYASEKESTKAYYINKYS